ncbi:MAG: NAD(P)H-dependent oxidoreductase [Gemmatimonadetes bacterium]|nr:NAD(P)H-dependent oxidoreductase [Gemmatimonadota bacterium]MXX34699.1 NAD(P)H-dependent oxidoreductase [Gemmatimonadota bacterium]MYD12574.1 NAD(P)H-dependent oxidoreductase [Gemmatimonadota bacterium]MYE70238.1 NAD(P)H-dependent oxidoreductase [Gemmatimonadota bacterium]MYI66079.1 NAD(P)H-dependent oxidoreductase [Gemmatimonadota bacterium]
MTTPLRIPVLVGSVRRGRQSIKVARFASSRLASAGADAPLLDLADFDLPIMEERLYRRDDPPPGLEPFSASIREADAVVVVSPEYNGSMPGVLKNALDYIYGEWFRKPVGIVTVSGGGFGGVQVHNHLQLLFLRLKALPVAGMAVSRVSQSFSEEGEPMEGHYEKAFAGFVETLQWYTRAIGTAQAAEARGAKPSHAPADGRKRG